MKKISLVAILLIAVSYVNAQFMVNLDDRRVKSVQKAGDDSPQFFVNNTVELNDPNWTEYLGKRLPLTRIADVGQEIKNVELLYNSVPERKRNKGWRSKFKDISFNALTPENTEASLENETNLREARGVTTQAIASVYQKLENNISGTANNLFDLGARLSNLRVKINTRIRYNIKPESVGGVDKYTLTRNQRSTYIYFDFISRAVLALDTLGTAVNEYVNSIEGSPLLLRWTGQCKLYNDRIGQITGKPEPKFFFNYGLDARLIPVQTGQEITASGGSMSALLGFTGVFPAADVNDVEDEDNLVVQLTVNNALMSSDVAESLFASTEKRQNFAASVELRVGLASNVNAARNFNVMLRHNLQEVTGPRTVLGFTFAPKSGQRR